MKTTMRLILRGVFDRYPNLKMILGHMAEFYPYLCDRMDNRFDSLKFMDPINKKQHSFDYYFRNKAVVTSGDLHLETTEDGETHNHDVSFTKEGVFNQQSETAKPNYPVCPNCGKTISQVNTEMDD